MGFIENIFECLGLSDFAEANKNKITIVGDVGGYFDSVKSIKSFSTDEIILVVKNGEIEISGENLSIKKYAEGDIAICGKIKRVERK